MDEVTMVLNKRKQELEQYIEKANQELKYAPSGLLRVSQTNQKDDQYYHIPEKQAQEQKLNQNKDHIINSGQNKNHIPNSNLKKESINNQKNIPNQMTSSPNGIYIKKKNREFAQKLAQKMYCEEIKTIASQQLSEIDSFLTQYDKNAITNLYETYPTGKKKLVSPYEIDDQTFCQIWNSMGKGEENDYPNHSELYSEKGEHVRSKTELLIADKLHHAKIPYKYEMRLILNDGKEVYPDFTILNPRTRKTYYWEHLGMMDDLDYLQSAIEKIHLYEKNGIILGEQLLLTFETKNKQIPSTEVDLYIQQYFQ